VKIVKHINFSCNNYKRGSPKFLKFPHIFLGQFSIRGVLSFDHRFSCFLCDWIYDKLFKSNHSNFATHVQCYAYGMYKNIIKNIDFFQISLKTSKMCQLKKFGILCQSVQNDSLPPSIVSVMNNEILSTEVIRGSLTAFVKSHCHITREGTLALSLFWKF